MRYFKKLLLNLAVLATEVSLIWVTYNAFTHKFTPLVGALSVIGLIVLLWFLLHLSKRRGFRNQRPGMIKTTLAVIAIVAICAFAGVQPLAGYKDSLFNNIGNIVGDMGCTNTEVPQNTPSDDSNVVIPKSPSTTPVTEEPTPQTTPTTNMEEKALKIGKEVVEIVNYIRVERGSEALLWDDKLYDYSLAHSKNMAEEERLFHTDINKSYAENAWGGEGSKSWGAEDIVESWMTSPKHRTWLLCPHLKHVAVGVAYSDYGMYASWTFWRKETTHSDWWYQYNPENPPEWWY